MNRGVTYTQGNAKKTLHSQPEFNYTSVVMNAAPERVTREREYENYNESPEEDRKSKPKVGRGVDVISMFFLVCAVFATLYICIHYLQIRSDIVQLEKSIVNITDETEDLRTENDAFESSLMSKEVDLDYVYRTAVGVLGMVYPNANEVYSYTAQGSSYYLQYNVTTDK